jgi:hypothetical protein
VLDLIDCEIEDNADDSDWISKFSKTHNCLESLSFECVPYPVNLDSLGSLIARSPNMRRLRVNPHISIGQLCRLLLRAPQLTHLGTGVFCSVNENEELEVQEMEAAFGSLKELICLSGFTDLKPELLPAIYLVCGQLTTLNLSYTDISAEQLEPLIRNCHNLLIFWVNPCFDLIFLEISKFLEKSVTWLYWSSGLKKQKFRSTLIFAQLEFMIKWLKLKTHSSTYNSTSQ